MNITERTRTIRFLASISLIITLVDYWFSGVVVPTLEGDTATILALNGYGGVFVTESWLFHASFIAQMLVLLALILSWKKARLPYVFVTLVFIVSTLIFGIGVSLPVQIFASTIDTYLNGGILVLVLSRTKTVHN